MSIFIEARLEGYDAAFEKLLRLGRFRPEPLMQAVAIAVQEQTIRHFENQAGPDGKWAGLRPSTLARRGGTAQILVDTGRLMGSIDHIVSGPTARVGSNVHYGKYHQFGTEKMVARAFLGLTGSDRDELEQVIEAHIESLLS